MVACEHLAKNGLRKLRASFATKLAVHARKPRVSVGAAEESIGVFRVLHVKAMCVSVEPRFYGS